MKLSARIKAMAAAFLIETRCTPRQLALRAGIGTATMGRVLGTGQCTTATAEALALVVLRDAPRGSHAARLADFSPTPATELPHAGDQNASGT